MKKKPLSVRLKFDEVRRRKWELNRIRIFPTADIVVFKLLDDKPSVCSMDWGSDGYIEGYIERRLVLPWNGSSYFRYGKFVHPFDFTHPFVLKENLP